MALANQNVRWHHTCLRVKDPAVSVPFYEFHFGMTLLDRIDFPEMKFSLYFLAHLLPSQKDSLPTPGTPEAHKWLWNMQNVALELTHNHGTESDPNFVPYNNGNVEPHRGFGHIAVLTDDVYAVSEELEGKGVKFQKRPDEGRMKGLAFALDPDGYWIEIIKRKEGHSLPGKYNLAQTMIRVKDPKLEIPFFTDLLGMKRACDDLHFQEAKFSLTFLYSAPDLVDGDDMKGMFNPVLELTHNHGTEDDESFQYHNGNTDPKGFGHVAFLVDNLDTACEALEGKVEFIKRPQDGKMRGIAFIKSPSGYWVELVQRGLEL